MDNLTHTLFALTLAHTPLRRAGKGTTAALVIASNVPDVDAVSLAWGTTMYLRWHRGPTHGPIGVVVLAAATAALVWGAYRKWGRGSPTGTASFAMLAGVSLIGTVFHVLMDVPTSYGTRVLSPFSWTWYAVDWLPIVDVYLLAILAAGLIAAGLSPASRRRIAAAVLVLVAVDYGVRAAAHHRVLALAPGLFGPAMPAACSAAPTVQSGLASWPRPAADAAVPPNAGSCLVELAAIPTFTSPFRWRVVARLSSAYELHEVDLLNDASREAFWRMVMRVPDVWTAPTFAASKTDLAQRFLGFSRFPAARTFVDGSGAATVRWTDVRFAGGVLELNGRRRVSPFSLVVQIAPDGRVTRERLQW